MTTIPCQDCQIDCELKRDLLRIIRISSSPAQDDSEFVALVQTLVQTLSELTRSGAINTSEQLGIALAALFDLCVSLEYAKLVVDTDWLYCPPHGTYSDPVLLYTYTKACPRCAASGAVVWDKEAKAHKPGSDQIGNIAAKTLGTLLNALGQQTEGTWQILQTTRQIYDIDMLLFNGDVLALCEIKASPLIAFPLIAPLPRELRQQSEDNEQETVVQHRATDLLLMKQDELFLYVPHLNKGYNLGNPSGQDFPLRAFRTLYANNVEEVFDIIKAWARLYEGYAHGWTQDENKRLRYMTFGCGGGVDDSKNQPGIDRTDDIKKGVYQMLKLGEHFASRCPSGALKVVLLANIHAVRHHSNYLSGMEDITWTHDGNLYEMEEPEWRKVRVADLVQLYDAAITLTRPHFRDEPLRHGFGLDELLRRLQGETT